MKSAALFGVLLRRACPQPASGAARGEARCSKRPMRRRPGGPQRSPQPDSLDLPQRMPRCPSAQSAEAASFLLNCPPQLLKSQGLPPSQGHLCLTGDSCLLVFLRNLSRGFDVSTAFLKVVPLWGFVLPFEFFVAEVVGLSFPPEAPKGPWAL